MAQSLSDLSIFDITRIELYQPKKRKEKKKEESFRKGVRLRFGNSDGEVIGC